MTVYFVSARGKHVRQVRDEPGLRGQEGAPTHHPQAQGPRRVRPPQQEQQDGHQVSDYTKQREEQGCLIRIGGYARRPKGGNQRSFGN